jgi:rhodanese-related sulfurtransferase
MEQLIAFASDNFFLAGIWLGLVILLIYSFIAPMLAPYTLLDTTETTFKMNKEDAIILDIRKPDVFKKGHILGARQLKKEEIDAANFNKLEKHKTQPIIVVCEMGMSAKKVASNLHKAGFSKAAVLNGGMASWTDAKLPLTK